MDPTKQPGIEIAQALVESAHFEHRADYLSLPRSQSIGTLPLTFRYQYVRLKGNDRGVLRLELTTARDKNPLYLIDLVMVGLVRVIPGAANMPLEQYAAMNGAAMLFPFLRETVANLTSRGRFGPVWLRPLNLTIATEESNEAAKQQRAVAAEGRRTDRTVARRRATRTKPTTSKKK